MTQDLPRDIAQRLMEAANSVRTILDELRPFIPAIRIENQVSAGKGDHVADLEIVHTNLANRKVKVTYQIKLGDYETLTQPAIVDVELPKEPQPDPGPIPHPPSQLPGSHEPPTLDPIRKIIGDIVQVRITKQAKPGTRVYIRLDNLLELPLHAVRTVPDDFPWGDGKSTGFLAAPTGGYSSANVGPHGHYKTWLTQPLNEAETEQLILFYSNRPYILTPKIIAKPHIG